MLKRRRKHLRSEDESVEVVLEQRERSYAFGEPRVNAGLLDLPPDAGANIAAERLTNIAATGEDKLDIRKVVEAFEAVAPEEVVGTHGKHTLPTYVSVSDGKVMSVDKRAVEKWVKSAAFKSLSTASKGKPRLVEFHVSLTDENTAVATYSLTQGKLHGTSAVVLVKDNNEWRIAVHCQHPVTE